MPDVGAPVAGQLEQRRVKPRPIEPDRGLAALVRAVGQPEARARRRFDAHGGDGSRHGTDRALRRARSCAAPRARRVTRRPRTPASAMPGRARTRRRPGRHRRAARPATRRPDHRRRSPRRRAPARSRVAGAVRDRAGRSRRPAGVRVRPGPRSRSAGRTRREPFAPGSIQRCAASRRLRRPGTRAAPTAGRRAWSAGSAVRR